MTINNLILSISAVLILLIVLTAGCVTVYPDTGNEDDTEEYSLNKARIFILNSVTYEFDGSKLQHMGTSYLDCRGCWKFTFNFESSHAGYGDRTDEVLAQVITPHTAVIRVEDGEVTSGVLDNVWDMMKQEFIKE